MNKPSLLHALLTAALVLAALNLVMDRWSHKLPYYRKLEQIRTAQDPNLLLVGNSLLDRHLDENAFVQAANESQFRPLNSALGASLPPEQRLLFNYAVEQHRGIRTVVVGFYDFQLTSPDRTRVTDLVGNRMIGVDKRFPISEVASVYGFGTLDTMELMALRDLPMASNRAKVWMTVELLRRSIGSLGMPREETNSLGRVDDFDALESASMARFDGEAAGFAQRPDQFNASYEAIFARARRAGMNVVIVLMPISPYHRDVFYQRPAWRTYLAALTSLANRDGIEMVDASDWLPAQGDFADHLHMTPQGARAFSSELSAQLEKLLARSPLFHRP